MIYRLEPGSTLVIATHNQGKRAEFAGLLAPFGVTCRTASDYLLPAPEETGADFAANARVKALAAARDSGLPALADDSGLTVAAMDGAPGIRSARFASDAGGYPQAMEAIIGRTRKDARAAFCSAICFALPSGETATYVGICTGMIIDRPRGESGFGYDPIFAPVGRTRTFAEIGESQKNAISHRARAFRQFAIAHLGG